MQEVEPDRGVEAMVNWGVEVMVRIEQVKSMVGYEQGLRHSVWPRRHINRVETGPAEATGSGDSTTRSTCSATRTTTTPRIRRAGC